MRTQVCDTRPQPLLQCTTHPHVPEPLALILRSDTDFTSLQAQNNSPVPSPELSPLLWTCPDGHLSVTGWCHHSNSSVASRPRALAVCEAPCWITSTLRLTSLLHPREGAGAVVPVWPRRKQRLQGLTGGAIFVFSCGPWTLPQTQQPTRHKFIILQFCRSKSDPGVMGLISRCPQSLKPSWRL